MSLGYIEKPLAEKPIMTVILILWRIQLANATKSFNEIRASLGS